MPEAITLGKKMGKYGRRVGCWQSFAPKFFKLSKLLTSFCQVKCFARGRSRSLGPTPRNAYDFSSIITNEH